MKLKLLKKQNCLKALDAYTKARGGIFKAEKKPI